VLEAVTLHLHLSPSLDLASETFLLLFFLLGTRRGGISFFPDSRKRNLRDEFPILTFRVWNCLFLRQMFIYIVSFPLWILLEPLHLVSLF
jgi:hypothetical protein